MKKALILYNSKTGTTKKLGEDIHEFLCENNIISDIKSIDEVTDFTFPGIDYFFLGCWTSGLFVVMQRPEKLWVEFAKKLPVIDSTRTALFTTYMLSTGSMFRNMKKHLKYEKKTNTFPEIKSRNGYLPEYYKDLIKKFINS